MAARYPHIDSDEDDLHYQSYSDHDSDHNSDHDSPTRAAKPKKDQSDVNELVEDLSSLAIKGNRSDVPEENSVANTWTVHRNSHPELDRYKALWAEEQLELKKKLSVEDCPEVLAWKTGLNKFANLKLVGGVDISFIKGDEVNACAMLVILEFPSLKLLHQETAMVELTLPYIPGFLAFREVPFLKERLDLVIKRHPELIPEVILVDGNGILHTRGFGLASQLGVMSDIPTIGVAKTLFAVDGLYKDKKHMDSIAALKKGGDSFPLIGISGKTWGMALLGEDKVINPVYVSAGHKICLDTAKELVFACSRSRIPEPVRQADLRSREFIRKLQRSKQPSNSKGKKQYKGDNKDKGKHGDRQKSYSKPRY